MKSSRFKEHQIGLLLHGEQVIFFEKEKKKKAFGNVNRSSFIKNIMLRNQRGGIQWLSMSNQIQKGHNFEGHDDNFVFACQSYLTGEIFFYFTRHVTSKSTTIEKL